MRTDGYDEQRLHHGPDDRTAGAEGVGRGAGRGRGDHPVAPPSGQRPAVDLDDHLEHPLAGALLHRRLVQRPTRTEQPAVAGRSHVDRQSLLHVVVAGQDVLDGPLEVGRLGLGEEPDATKVDAEQRHAAVARELGGPQDRPVSAEHQHELGASGRLGAGGVDGHACQPHGLGLLREQPHLDAGVLQSPHDGAGRLGRLGTAGVG